jgi:hypothetical protein
MKGCTRILIATALSVLTWTGALADGPHNVILFVPDGLRAGIVNPDTAPTMARVRDAGVNFRNSHSLFPTFTTANASVFATGHGLGDTGAFSNTIWSPFPIKSAKGSVTPFLEADPPLKELNAGYDHRLWNEDSLVARAAAAGYSTAIVGKVGPTAVFDLNSMQELPGRTRTLIVDDLTGHENGIEPPSEWRERFERAGVPLVAPARGDNGNFGSFNQPGTKVPGDIQQQYFLSVASQVVLPEFRKVAKPFFLVYWSRDPDGSQHNQGDSFHQLSPGINGPTSLAAVKSVDAALAALESRLKELGLYDDTDILVVADHGFSTLSKESHTSAAAQATYPDVVPGDLPLGFLALDLAHALKEQDPSLRLFDPDSDFALVEAHQHPVRGNAVIGVDPSMPELIVGVNGGSDLLYIPDSLDPTVASNVAHTVMSALLEHDYVSGLFVDEHRFGKIPGALSLDLIGITNGAALTPKPAMIVSFRSWSTGCAEPTLCAVEVSDYFLQQGQGMHGSFSRADTWNFMAAQGPDFRKGFIDPLPASNADIGVTIAKLLHLELHPKGPLSGRVLSEALRDAPRALPRVKPETIESERSANGLQTVLKTQKVGSHVYWDAAGFPGRTVGLESH